MLSKIGHSCDRTDSKSYKDSRGSDPSRARSLIYIKKTTAIATVVAARRVVLIDFDHADPDFTYSNDEAEKQ